MKRGMDLSGLNINEITYNMKNYDPIILNLHAKNQCPRTMKILSLHAKNQRPRSMLLFKFSEE